MIETLRKSENSLNPEFVDFILIKSKSCSYKSHKRLNSTVFSPAAGTLEAGSTGMGTSLMVIQIKPGPAILVQKASFHHTHKPPGTLSAIITFIHTPSIILCWDRSNIRFLKEKEEFNAAGRTGMVFLLVLERHLKQDIQRPAVSVSNMMLLEGDLSYMGYVHSERKSIYPLSGSTLL